MARLAVLDAPLAHDQARVHVAVGNVVRDHGVPAADVLVRKRVDQREVVVGEEAQPPVVVVVSGVFERLEASLVDGLVTFFVVLWLAVLVGHGEDVHVAPEEVGPFVEVGEREVEVLELGEAEEDGGLDDVDAEEFELGVVEVKGVLEAELAAGVGLLHAGVFDDVDLVGWPAGCDVARYGLEEHRPVTGESDEERGGHGQVVLFVQLAFWLVPFGNCWGFAVLEHWEGILEWRGEMFGIWFVLWSFIRRRRWVWKGIVKRPKY